MQVPETAVYSRTARQRSRRLLLPLVLALALTATLATTVALLLQRGGGGDGEGNSELNASTSDDNSSSDMPALAGKTDADDSSNGTRRSNSAVANTRLLCEVEPIHYQLLLVPLLYGENASSFRFCGSVSVRFRALENCSLFTMHAGRNLNVSDVRIDDSERNLTVVSQKSESQLLLVQLAEPLAIGQEYTVSVDRFESKLHSKVEGLFASGYRGQDGRKQFSLSTQMEPVDARLAFPCFDEPSLKATFDVGVVRRSDYKAAANMPSLSNTTVSIEDWFPDASDASNQSWVLEQFETTPKMPTYLVALHVSQFEFASLKDKSGRLYRVWAPGQYVKCCTAYALKTIIELIEHFESRLGMAYQLNKTDQLAEPGFTIAQAMENWGLIVYTPPRLLYNKLVDTAEWRQQVATVIGHEVAHSWFGNLVTPASWANLWLSEGLATYMGYIDLGHLRQDWEMDAHFVVTEQLDAFEADASPNSPAASSEMPAPLDKFNTISYSKAASVMRQLEQFIGADAFAKALADYLRGHSYAAVRPEYLYSAFQQAVGKRLQVEEMMRTWIDQPGFPLLTCRRDGHNDTRLLLKQSRFLSRPAPSNATWILPVTMVTSENVSSWNRTLLVGQEQWMREEEQAFHLIGEGQRPVNWYLVNLLSAGHYRVNYDRRNWAALCELLTANHETLTQQDRAKLLDDSFALSRAGQLDMAIPLELVKYLGNETQVAPWLVALRHFRRLRQLMYHEPLYGHLADYIRSLLRPAFARVVNNSEESQTQRRLRGIIVQAACEFELPECQRDMRRRFKQLKLSDYVNANANAGLSPDIRTAVLCEGVRSGRVGDWHRVLRLRNTTSLGVAADVHTAVACTRRQWQLQLLLRRFYLTGQLSGLSRKLVTKSLAASSDGIQAMQYYTLWLCHSNWAGIGTTVGLLNEMRDVSNVWLAEELESCANRHKKKQELSKLWKIFSSSAARIRANAAWLRRIRLQLQRWPLH